MHTARGSLRLRSRGAHCDPELARQDQRSRLAMKIGEEGSKEEGGGRGGGGGGGRTTVIKSNNPHLAGGEKNKRVQHPPTTVDLKGIKIFLLKHVYLGQLSSRSSRHVH